MPHCNINFAQQTLAYRVAHLQGKNELIAKAIGFKKGLALTVMDATAGMGKEAWLLAALGCTIHLFERHPEIASLLSDALLRAKMDANLSIIAERITFYPQCAIAFLQQAQLSFTPDIIYCDPMFEPSKKTALVKKEMQFLQSVVGTDEDGALLVALARQHALKRVVVKRALRAPLLADKPDCVFTARSHRFDVYIKT